MPHAEYLLSAVKPQQYPEILLPEIAFIGRSNVGKSSLINSLLNRKNLARVSGQPGKTQTINYYLIDKSWFVVDLPGYGYAKVSKDAREQWQKMIEKYLMDRPEAKFYWQLVDIRHQPSAQDVAMQTWLKSQNLKRLVVATKLDKITKSARNKNLAVIRNTLELAPDELFAYSAVTKEGITELWLHINAFLQSQNNHQ